MRSFTGLVMACALAFGSVHAGTVVVLSADLGPYQEAFHGVKSRIPDASSVILEDGKADVGSATVVVALGGQAALADYPASAALVVAMVADPDVVPAREYTRVAMLPDPAVLFSKIAAIQPGVKTLTVFDVKSNYGAYLRSLRDVAKASSWPVDIKNVDSTEALVTALRGLQGGSALWVPPDPVVMNPDAFKLISEYCSSTKIGLYAPATGLANAGALASIAPTFEEIGSAAGKAAAALQQGLDPGGSVEPHQCQVVINASAAQAMGLHPDAGIGQVIQ